MFTATSGLLAHQTKMDVIANNIANVNTVGYRGSRALFQDIFYQTLSGAAAPSTNYGGTNPRQIGLGVTLASIDTNFTQGTLQTTGFASDLAIQGRGFFILNDGSGTGDGFYTRDGSFQLNVNGELIDPATGMFVQGYLADEDGNVDTNTAVTNIVVPLGGASIVRATENVSLVGNLDSRANTGDTIVRSVRVFDSLGTVRNVQLTFTKTANINEWTWDATTSDPEVVGTPPPSPLPSLGSGTIQFDPDGTVSSVSATTITMDFLNAPPPAGVDPTTVPESPLVFELDLTELSQLADDSDATVDSQDGLGRGVLEAFNVGADGSINGIYSNGLTRTIGQVALASFANNGGLVRAGDNTFVPSSNSGIPMVGVPNSGGRGEISGGTLEASNVDLGTEFTQMILTQRGYQANARTFTTADTLLQEAVNLVR